VEERCVVCGYGGLRGGGSGLVVCDSDDFFDRVWDPMRGGVDGLHGGGCGM
jgi:hypothetical protein